jgi:hypothetical protein
LMDTIITLICKDEPGSIEIGGCKIANLSHILEEKFKLANASNPLMLNSDGYTVDNKHDLDLKQIITNFVANESIEI